MSDDPGFVLRCEADGRIAAVVHDTYGLDAAAWIGRPFTTLIAPGALGKALEFFRGISGEGAEYHWEMPVAPGNRTMVFVGARYDRGILVAASATALSVEAIIAELSRIGDEQANTIRHLAAQARRPPPPPDAAAFEELTRLNIEFANMQRELARKNAELARANERKSLMLGMAAHDLRNPLSAITGFAGHLERRAGGKLDDAERKFLRYIAESTRRMLGIVEGVLELSRTETGKLVLDRRPTDLGALVRDTVALNEALAAAKGIALQAQAPDSGPELAVDAPKIVQVLNNLIGNAMKFSTAGTRVLVSVSAAAEHVEIAVADQGPGIPPDEQEKLFQPFSRTSVRSTAGEPSTGLGLAITRSIVDGHGGRVTVDSAPGRGTTFRVVLPVG